MLLLAVIGQTLAIYVFLVVVLSRVGRSLMAGLRDIDYLIAALLGSAVETGLYCGSDSLWAGIASAATLIAADRATSLLMDRCPHLRRLLTGGPMVLVHDGELIESHLRQARLTEADVRSAIRKRGYDDLDAVHLAVIECNGEIAVVPTAGRRHR